MKYFRCECEKAGKLCDFDVTLLKLEVMISSLYENFLHEVKGRYMMIIHALGFLLKFGFLTKLSLGLVQSKVVSNKIQILKPFKMIQNIY